MPSWAIIQKNRRILFLQRSKNTSRPTQWFLPGGKIKPQESPEDTCTREVKEETAIEIKIEELVAEVDGAYFYACDMCDPDQRIILKKNESMDYQWVVPEKLLQTGEIMSFRLIHPILKSLGYEIELNEEATKILG